MQLNSSLLSGLRFFEAAARHLSFTRAARELHISPGAVSQQIKHLENQLGFKLFHRLTRRIELTEEGLQLAPVVSDILETLHQEITRLQSCRRHGIVHLQASPSFALKWLIPKLGDFYRRYPEIALHIHTEHNYLVAGTAPFDLAVDFSLGDYPGYDSEMLMDEWLLPVCHPKLLKPPMTAQLDQLKKQRLLHDASAWQRAAPDTEWQRWAEQAGFTGIDQLPGQFYSRSDLALEAALAGQGIAMARARLLGNLLESHRLIAPFNLRIPSPASYYLVTPKGALAKPGIRALFDWLRNQI
jgi:LysR family glycine cleavage system transcriptional activator